MSVKKIGLRKLYKTNKFFKKWIRQLMSLPFLLEEDIKPTFLAIQVQLIELPNLELELVNIHSKDTLPKHGLMETKAYLYFTRVL